MWNDSYDITAAELKEIMNLIETGGYECTIFEPGETLYIVLANVEANAVKKFEFTKC